MAFDQFSECSPPVPGKGGYEPRAVSNLTTRREPAPVATRPPGHPADSGGVPNEAPTAIPKPNIATAAKAKTTSAVVNAKVLAAAAKQSPLINPNQVQNQGTDGSSQGNRPRPGFEGPSPAIPEVSRPGYTPATAEEQQATLNNALGLVSKTDAMKQLAGVGTSSTAAQSEKDKLKDLSGSSTTNQPSSDQGFGSQPNVDANTVPGGNPMAPYQGGSVGGCWAWQRMRASRRSRISNQKAWLRENG